MVCLKLSCSYQHSSLKYSNTTVEVSKCKQTSSTVPVFFKRNLSIILQENLKKWYVDFDEQKKDTSWATYRTYFTDQSFCITMLYGCQYDMR